jgi:mRNA interferase HigB
MTTFRRAGLKARTQFDTRFVTLVWFGTHKEYDKINAKTISYVKANKK